jgi:hypothetical protein
MNLLTSNEFVGAGLVPVRVSRKTTARLSSMKDGQGRALPLQSLRAFRVFERRPPEGVRK